MAKVFISEYRNLPVLSGRAVPTGDEPAVAEQVIAIGGSSVASSAFNAATRFIRVHTDAICSFKFGAAPTATADTPRLAANSTEFFGVLPGHKIAIITNT